MPFLLALKWKLSEKAFSNVKTKTNSSFAVKVTERSNHSFLLSIWWICVNILKTSEAANLVFQWIFVLNQVLPLEHRTTTCLHCQNPSIRTNSLCCSGLLWTSWWFLQVNQKSVLEWFLLLMSKRFTMTRSTDLFGRNHSTSFLIKKRRLTEPTRGLL